MTRKRIGLAAVLVLLLTCLFSAVAAHAQAVYGSIFGTVTDPSGAAVANAKVTVTSVQKGTTHSAASNATGNYNVTHLIPGTYNVRVEAPGFKVFEATSIQVFADQSARVDGQFQVGTEAQSVTVTAEDVPLVKTDRADVSTTFSEKAVMELPIFDRNFTQFELLTPGTSRLMWQHASAENPQGSIQIMVNGQHFSGTSFQLDGTDNRDPILGIIVINPTLESVTQTKVTTQNYDAEFGQALAAVVTAQTKSGTNSLHGSGFWFRRSDATQARNPFTESQRNPITGKFLPSTLWNQFGGSLGGPIVKNKLFFFGDYQATRSKSGNTQQLTVPTALVRSTCLAGLPCNLSEYAVQIFDPAVVDPAARTAFPGAIIPAGRLSPQAVALLKLLPPPNASGINNNFNASGSGIFNENAFNVRVDHQTSEKLHLFGRYSFADFKQSALGAFGAIAGGQGFGIDSFAGQSLTRNQSLASGFDYSFSPTLLTDFRFGFFRYRVNVLPNGIGTHPATDVGIPGLNVDDFFTSGMPAFFIGAGRGDVGSMAFGYGLSDRLNRCNCPLREQEKQFQFVNNWTKIVGNHNLKFGADIRHAHNLRVPSDAHRSGELTFETAGTSGPAGGGLALATFLLGDVSSLQRFVSSTTNAAETQNRTFYYGQDTWRVTPKLTLNYGLRWEIYFPQKVTETAGGGFVDTNTGNIRVAGVGGINQQMNVKNSWTNFAPRLGIAYQFNPKTVVRLGYGRSFDIGVFGSVFGHTVTQNLPVLARQNVRGPNGNNFETAFTLAQGPPAPVFPPVPSNGLIPLPPGLNQSVLPQKMRLPTIDTWNLTIQREITPTISGEIGYVGNKGTHVFAGNNPDYNCNQPVIGPPGSPRDPRRPFFARFGWTQDLRCLLSDASSNYNALQTKLEKRFSHGLQFLLHYTWSKSLNYDSEYYVNDPRLQYGVTDFDRAHVIVFTNLWELPFGRGKTFLNNAGGVLDRIIGGWQINSVTSWYSGFPFSPTYRDCGSDRDTGPCRPNIVGTPHIGGGRNQWFTVSPVEGLANLQTGGPWQRPAPGTFGKAPRNSLRGPAFFNTDLSVFKNFLITERWRFQFRAEAFNVFNHVNLGTPGIFNGNNCVDCTDAGKIVNIAQGAQMRQFQFGLKLQF